jgi:hypothetical protein
LKKAEVEQMILVGDLTFFFSKQTLLRISQMDQQKAAKPTTDHV